MTTPKTRRRRRHAARASVLGITAIAALLFAPTSLGATRSGVAALQVALKSRGLYRGAIDNFKFPEDNEYLAYLEPAIASFLAGQPIARAETASFGCAIQTVYYRLPKQL